MVSRVTPAGNQVPGTPAPSSFANGVAGGYIGRLSVTTTQGSITGTEVTLTGLSITVTANSARLLWITFRGQPNSSIAGDNGLYRIKEGGTTLQEGPTGDMGAGGSGQIAVEFSTWVTPSGGSHTYSVTLQRTVGTGTFSNVASGTNPSWITVYDMGPA